MNSDIRLSVDFWEHAKTLKLIRVLGLQGAVSLQKLWCYAAKYRPEGVLFKMDLHDIKAVSGWPKKAEKFVETLLDLQWIHQNDDGIFILHQWEEYNPWAAAVEKRVERAKKGAKARWGSENATSINKQCLNDATSINKQCTEHMLNGCLSDAPSPSPSPAPKESKKPTSEVSTENPEVGQLSETEKPVSDAAVALAEVLREEINKRSPNGKPLIKPTTSMKSWAIHFQRMINLDNRSPPEIEAVIRWSQTDPFWRNNILSPAKLREKWPQLVLKMHYDNGRPKETIDEWAARKEAEIEDRGVQEVCEGNT